MDRTPRSSSSRRSHSNWRRLLRWFWARWRRWRSGVFFAVGLQSQRWSSCWPHVRLASGVAGRHDIVVSGRNLRNGFRPAVQLPGRRDFLAGGRSAVVTKGPIPVWSAGEVASATTADVTAVFQPVSEEANTGGSFLLSTRKKWRESVAQTKTLSALLQTIFSCFCLPLCRQRGTQKHGSFCARSRQTGMQKEESSCARSRQRGRQKEERFCARSRQREMRKQDQFTNS